MRKLKIIIAHNFYQQPGGEDEVFYLESKLLKKYGHEVVEFIKNNSTIKNMNPFSLLLNTFWSVSSEREMNKLLRDFKPDLVHFHNIFPLISPSAINACVKRKVPVVVSLHNPRLICPAATLCRNGQSCEECSNKLFSWPAILHKCYRNSYVQSFVVVAMLTSHRLIKTWQKKVNIYLVATEFYRKKFIKAGLPADKMVIKPYFVEDRGVKEDKEGGYVLFVGRFSPEKGILTLLKAWQSLKDIPLKIRGEGILSDQVIRIIEGHELGSTIEIVKRLNKEQLYSLVKGARFLIMPSEGFYETFGLVILEAFSCGIPVIASRIGVMTEIINDGKNGLHFTAGDENDLAQKVRSLWGDKSEAERMGKEARKNYEEKYSSNRNYDFFKGVYNSLIEKVS